MNRSRLDRVIRNMEQLGADCILVSAPHSVYYLTGLMIHPGERMLALLITKDGSYRLFANRLFALPEQEDLPITEFDDTEDPVAILASFLPAGACVGVDKLWPSRFTVGLMELRKDLRITLGSGPVDDARLIKDEEEIALMRESSRLNDQAVSRLIPLIREGIRESDLAAHYLRLAKELGAQGDSFEPLICFGAHCAEPHHSTDDTVLGPDQTVIMDVGLKYGRMCSDMTRTVVFGRADDEMKRVYDLVLKANEAGRKAARPGIPMAEIDRAARSVIEEGGYGKYFIHRTGHGIGLEVHEPTDCSAVNPFIARAGMAFSIEPGIYLPGKFGVRIEDLVILTEDGAETLNRLDRALIEL